MSFVQYEYTYSTLLDIQCNKCLIHGSTIFDF